MAVLHQELIRMGQRLRLWTRVSHVNIYKSQNPFYLKYYAWYGLTDNDHLRHSGFPGQIPPDSALIL